MESTEDKLLFKIRERLEKYSKFTNVSSVSQLFERYLKTNDITMGTFLLKRVLSKLNKIARAFPFADFLTGFPELKDVSNGIKVGDIIVDGADFADFRISKSDLNRNLLVTASVGHGKTSLIYNILSRLKNEGITFMVFDLKRDYRQLMFEENTLYLDKNNLRINPLLPPKGISKKEWAVHFADAFAHSFSLLIGSRDFLLDSLLEFYKNLNELETPTLSTFLRYLDGMKVRNDYLRVVKGRLRATLSATDIFNCKKGVSFADIDNMNVIISAENLGTAEQGFLFSFILSYLFYLNINDIQKRNKLYKMIVVDDAHSILDSSKERDYAMGVPLIHQIVAKMRELGIGFIFSDQQISTMLSSVIQNSNTKFIGKMNLIGDMYRMVGNKPADDLLPILSNLNVGEFLTISSKVSPFCIVRSENIRINKNVDESLITLLQSRYAQKLGIGFEEDRDASLDEFLYEIDRNPSFNISLHVKNLDQRMDHQKFELLRQKLMADGIIAEIDLPTSEDKSSKFIYIAKSGENKLGSAYGIKSGTFTVWDRVSFTKKVLREIVKSRLKKLNVTFNEDDAGILITGLKKIYIVFMDTGDSLSRIIETSFDRVIDVIDESTSEQEILTNLFKSSKASALANLRTLKVCNLENFNLN